jgi:hypothetical protein
MHTYEAQQHEYRIWVPLILLPLNIIMTLKQGYIKKSSY